MKIVLNILGMWIGGGDTGVKGAVGGDRGDGSKGGRVEGRGAGVEGAGII